jgi:DNA-binding response OmpR family regulator
MWWYAPAWRGFGQLRLAPSLLLLPDIMPRRRLLIVDDERDMLDCVAEVLGEHFDLTLARDGLEALSALRQSEFEVILLDLKMTGVDGFDVLNYLSSCCPHTRVMIASGLPRLDLIAERYGASDWLAKPYHLDVLEERVARLMGGEPERV